MPKRARLSLIVPSLLVLLLGNPGLVLADADGDGVDDPVDNCPIDVNPTQTDFDGDGTGDVCDPDYDNDGTLDGCGRIEDATLVLAGDVDCTARFLSFCNVALDLQGYTYSGDLTCINNGCSCIVRGPGTVEGAIKDDGFIQYGGEKTRITVENVAINNSVGYSVANGEGRVIVTGSTITGGAAGVLGSRVVISGSSISGTVTGVVAHRALKMFDTIVTGNVAGILSSRTTLKNVIVEHNTGTGVVAYLPETGGGKLVVRGGSISENGGHGIAYSSRSVTLRETSVSANALSGISWNGDYSCSLHGSGAKIKIRSANLTGNGGDVTCAGPGAVCTDVDTCVAPQLIDSVCDRSHAAESGAPGSDWGICSLD